MPADTSRPLAGGQAATELDRLFALQRAAFADEPNPARERRAARLDALIGALEANEDRIIKTIGEDFGGRAAEETISAEIIATIGAARLAKRRLARWMRPRAVPTPLHMAPGRSEIIPQPLGVVGIISPWNYPINLALSPAAAALAAGNNVMIKPSELTPRTAMLLKEMLGEAFEERVLAVVTGGPEVGEAFARAPFDHLLFTGSTSIGRKVAEAAARNLTPVTLELGGKSPAIIDPSADLAGAARAIAFGKGFNAGQTCVAPDYVLAPRGNLEATVDALAGAMRALYPEIDTTADYTAVISDRHFARLRALVEEARSAGARIVEIGSQNALHPQRKLPITLVVEPPASLRLMQEEIFGPILPVIGFESRGDAIARINAGERPLALYWFGKERGARDDVLARTIAGGVTINDTILHVAQEHLPFGGVGKSGMGAYHGDKGFETFSHRKPIFHQSRFSMAAGLHPPYTEKTRKTLALAKKII